MTEEISPFRFVRADETQIVNMEKIGSMCELLLGELDAYAHKGRYKSIAHTKLEEFAMFAKKAICRDGKV